MKVPVQWLADYVAVEMPTEELAHRLTMAGVKVESIERPGRDWSDVFIGEVVAIEPHPSSRNPLHVATVSLGDRSTTVVTGAQNVHQGDRAPIVMVGGRLPHGPDGDPMVIEARRMAGIASEGMLCSERELGLSDEHSGIYILPPDAPVGKPLRDLMGGDVLDIETKPNRPDTLSIIGIAREVAAITGQQLSLPNLDALSERVSYADQESLEIEIDGPDLCRRFTALRIEGAGVVPSPAWLAARLEAAGQRPINLLVDITNYVTLEYGQPMHAFDAALLAGDRLLVRRAEAGETMVTLDGATRTLSPEQVVIADAERIVSLAGIMGGENSEIKEDTSTLLLEAATWDPTNIRRSSKELGLRTEASSRFEKGLPQEQTVLAVKRYLQLLDQTLSVPLRVSRLSDVVTAPPERRTVTMPLRDVHRLIGRQIPASDAAESLSLLGFAAEVKDGVIEAGVPYWRRVDIEQSADLVEEVARLTGFDKIPSTLPLHTVSPQPLPPALHWELALRERLLAAGVNESLTHSLTSPESLSRLAGTEPGAGSDPDEEPWRTLVPNPAGVSAHEAELRPVTLLNPETRDRRLLRLLLLPSLLDAIARNLRNTDERLAFFEIDRVAFRRPGDLAYERRTLALALSGNRRPRAWLAPSAEPYDFFDVKGVVEAVLHRLRIRDYSVEPGGHPALHPGRAAVLRVSGSEIGFLGELHPRVAAAFEIEGWPVQVAELDLDTLFMHAREAETYRPLPRFPAAFRDIAVVVDEAVAAERVLHVIRRAGGDLLESLRIFDVYTGQPLQPGQKSMAVQMAFRAPGATLVQEDVNETMDAIVMALREELRASLRE